MSRPGDNFLARWSRRRHAVQAAEAPQDSPPRPKSDVSDFGIITPNSGTPELGGEGLGEGPTIVERQADNCSLDTSSQKAPPNQPPDSGAGDPSPSPSPQGGGEIPALPRIEDLTAGGDLTPFLRKGVPEALKRAAMRRMWSLDPAIRDYVGPSEYAWDFNDPSSIPGFGPAAPDSAVAELIAQLKAARPAVPNAPSIAEETADVAETAVTSAGDSRPEPGGTAAPAAERAPTTDQIAAADTASAPAAPEKPKGAAALRHGGALPR